MVNNDMHSSRQVVNGEILVGILTCETSWWTTASKTVALGFVTLPSGVMKTVLSAAGLQRSFTSPARCPGTQANVVVTVGNARSLWPASQQHTVHVSQQCLRVMAHFRTSVQDTVSVVAKHLGPPSQMNGVHLRLACTPLCKYPRVSCTHTHTHIHTFSILSPEEALHMKQENLTKMRQFRRHRAALPV